MIEVYQSFDNIGVQKSGSKCKKNSHEKLEEYCENVSDFSKDIESEGGRLFLTEIV